ncbi:hypothetical protein LGM57_37385 [Burkholderia cepacia]|nr:hypothetical protein [Burkholderia cepacia]
MNEVPVNRRLDAWPAGAARLALATLMSLFLLLPLALVVQNASSMPTADSSARTNSSITSRTAACCARCCIR